jgi:hypothetical protein
MNSEATGAYSAFVPDGLPTGKPRIFCNLGRRATPPLSMGLYSSLEMQPDQVVCITNTRGLYSR